MADLRSGSPLQIKIEGEPVGRASSFSAGREGSYTTPEVVDSTQVGPSKYTRKITRGNTRMSNSKTNGMVAPNDLEAQRHRSQWLSKLKTTLLVKNEEKEDDKWDFCILKVPEFRSELSKEYTPVAWQFGLHNRENLSTNGSEALKISFANAFGLVGDELDKFCNAVVDDPKSLLRCYGLQEEATNWSDDVIKYIVSLDALFLALVYDAVMDGEYLWTFEHIASMMKDTLFNSRFEFWIASSRLKRDLCKCENQIPIKLIQNASKYLRKLKLETLDQVPSDNDEAELYLRWEKKWKALAVQYGVKDFMDLDFNSNEELFEVFPLTNDQHILGLGYKAICGHEDSQRTIDYSHVNYFINIPSATQWIASGIKIKGVPDVPLCTMSYKNNCLYLPIMNLCDETTSFIRNMATYEKNLIGNKCIFHEYVHLLIDLVKTSLDMDILIRSGVIYNACGTQAFEELTALEYGLEELSSSKEYHNMKAAIKKRCDFKRHQLWSEFRTQFCSKPWFVMPTIAVTLVTVATLMQTYVAVIGSNGMKPQFPH